MRLRDGLFFSLGRQWRSAKRDPQHRLHWPPVPVAICIHRPASRAGTSAEPIESLREAQSIWLYRHCEITLFEVSLIFFSYLVQRLPICTLNWQTCLLPLPPYDAPHSTVRHRPAQWVECFEQSASRERHPTFRHHVHSGKRINGPAFVALAQRSVRRWSLLGKSLRATLLRGPRDFVE
ncbi:hypothetical protein MRX96_046038 [Rhipicephalus microplus]